MKNHDEDGGLKDPIMYHTNLRVAKTLHNCKVNEYPYFEFDSFNLHASGVDVTFENKEKQYRASFLIRSFYVFQEEAEIPEYQSHFNGNSTDIFDFMFPFGVNARALDMISWEQFSEENQTRMANNPSRSKRKGVYEYKLHGDLYVKTNKRCEREWRFTR